MMVLTCILAGILLLGLVTYDTSLTFSRELKCIWKRKPDLVTMLYLLQRWVLVLDGVVLRLPAANPQVSPDAILYMQTVTDVQRLRSEFIPPSFYFYSI